MKNYIFDLYGTLVDIKTDEWSGAVWEKIALYFSMQGADYTKEELKKAYFSRIKEEEGKLAKKLEKIHPGITEKEVEIDLAKVMINLYKAKGVKAGKQQVADTMTAMRTITMEKLCLFKGAKELLEALKAAGKKVYLLSNAQTGFTAPEVRMLGIEPYFDDIFYSSDLEVKKPSAYFYEALFQKHGLKKKESVMIGNDRWTDMQGAAEFGISGIYLHTEQSTPYEDELPEGCHEVADLFEIIKEIEA